MNGMLEAPKVPSQEILSEKMHSESAILKPKNAVFDPKRAILTPHDPNKPGITVF